MIGGVTGGRKMAKTSNISIVNDDGSRFMIEDAEHQAGCHEAMAAEIGTTTAA